MRRVACAVLFAVVALQLSQESNVFAQERGRLADGRAFRTDAEGNQLVDYIAELEINLEGLQTRVRGLESEVSDKQALIDRLRAEGRTDTVLREQNVPNGASVFPVKGPGQEESPIAQTSEQCLDERQQIAALSRDVESVKADLEIERQVGEQKSRELEEALESAQEKLQTQEQSITALNAELVSARELATTSDSALVRAREELEEVRRQELVRVAAIEQARREREADPRAAISMARLRAVEVVRGKVRTELNQVKGLIGQRDADFARYRGAGKGVTFKPQAAVSELGSSVKDLEKRLAEVSSVAEASRIGREIEQIRTRMNDDRALIQRMQRSRH